jgi:hypothetical protein
VAGQASRETPSTKDLTRSASRTGGTNWREFLLLKSLGAFLTALAKTSPHAI